MIKFIRKFTPQRFATKLASVFLLGTALSYPAFSQDVEGTVELSADKKEIEVLRLNQQGEKIAGKMIEIKTSGLFQRRSGTGLIDIFKAAKPADNEEAQVLLARRMGDKPLAILGNQPYREWQTVFNQALIDLHSDIATRQTDQ